MSDRNEKAKKVLDNSTKVVAIIGIVAILFAVWFSIKFAKSKTKQEFDNRQTYFNDVHQYFNTNWANNAYWDSVGIESKTYVSEHETFTYSIRKETFNDQFNVKTSTTARPDLYKVLNASIVKIDTSKTNRQAQLATLCMNPLVLHKYTVSTHDTWGITHKSFFNLKSVITLKYDSYKDKEGIDSKVLPKDVLLEDQLPICLRALKFNDSSKFSVKVLESQLNPGLGPLKIYNAAVSMQSENENEMNVEVKLDDKMIYNFIFEKKYPNALVRFFKNKHLYSTPQ